MGVDVRGRLRRRLALAVLAGSLIAVLAKPAFLVARATILDRPVVEAIEPGFADDESRRHATSIAEIWSIPDDPEAAEEQLRDLLARARREHLHVSIAGARHTLGGHTIAPGGIVINMLPFHAMELDAGARRLHLGAGARWSEIIPYLDARDASVAIMQSNDDFTVGGSLSVNCHGWQVGKAPIASTVLAFRLMKADGQIVRCTPTENADLFGLALGGYGLFGVILDAELRVVPNERYETRTSVVTVGDFSAAFRAQIADERVEMAYGRLCVAPGDEFLREGMITVFRKAPCPREEIPQLAPPRLPWLRRALFRAQIGSDAGKVLRWTLEKKIGEQVSARYLSRNQLFYESARVYTERNVDRVDVLQESFVPIRRFAEFVERVRAALARHPADLLNVTVREVARDDVTFLRYADDEMMAVVMLFDEERTAAGDRRMQELAGDLIDAALACDGRYYLPYRLDATREQFERAYPMARDWADRKGRYDPQDLFENLFFTRYAGR